MHYLIFQIHLILNIKQNVKHCGELKITRSPSMHVYLNRKRVIKLKDKLDGEWHMDLGSIKNTSLNESVLFSEEIISEPKDENKTEPMT